MLEYQIINAGKQRRMVYQVGGTAYTIEPKTEKSVSLDDGTAVLLRRNQIRGDSLKIQGLTDRANEVLEKAKHRRVKREHFNMLGTKPGEDFVDQIEQDRLAEIAKAKGESKPQIIDEPPTDEPLQELTDEQRRALEDEVKELQAVGSVSPELPPQAQSVELPPRPILRRKRVVSTKTRRSRKSEA